MRHRLRRTALAAVAALAVIGGTACTAAGSSPGGAAASAPATQAPPAPRSSVPAVAPYLSTAPSTSGSAAPAKGPTREERNCGNQSGKVLLTFDDHASSDDRLREFSRILTDKKVGGFFFPVAQDYHESKTGPEKPIIGELRKAGFWVGNHSWSHPVKNPAKPESRPLTQLTPDAKIVEELYFGVESTYFRPPGGDIDHRVRHYAGQLGLRLCHWTFDTYDWRTGAGAKSGRDLVAMVMSDKPSKENPWPVKAGSVILMHFLDHSKILEVFELNGVTQTALEHIIDGLRNIKKLKLCALPSKPTTKQVPYPLPC